MGLSLAKALRHAYPLTQLELIERHPALEWEHDIFVPNVFQVVGDYAVVFDEEALAAYCATRVLLRQGDR